jgi:hypothetical protein
MTTIRSVALALALTGATAAGCARTATTVVSNTSGGTTGGTTTVPNASNSALPAGYRLFSDSVTITVEGSTIVLRTKDVPDHKSVYFPITDPRYEAYNGTNPLFNINPNRIATQSLTFRIPMTPSSAATKSATPLGPIGISRNGVVFFNQYAGQNQPLTNEINSFDQANGHPQQSGQYHYHVEPLRLTEIYGKDALLGFLLDGFPVYGPLENGKTLTNADLDIYHGHTAVTREYPNGIYHYHITASDPFINGSGFYGIAGTVGN